MTMQVPPGFEPLSAVDGETEHVALFPGKRCFVVVRQIAPGAHDGLFVFTDSDLVAAASSESAAAQVYDIMLGDEQREWSAKSKQRASGELFAATPVRGSA
jgi:hypothetical protein